MDFLKDRRVILLLGAAVALVGGLGIAWVFMSRTPASTEPPPASQGGLVVVSGRDDDQKLDPKRPLRCFVGGQFVGELPLEVCAQRNGVATGALDVGLDPSGALAASNGVNANITPLPPTEPPLSQPLIEPDAANTADDSNAASGQAAAGSDCWRYVGGGWKKLPTPLSLSACVQAVYGARCPPPGQAFYGRWGDQSLRLQDGHVGISSDNSNFQSLIDTWPACKVKAPEPARPATAAVVGSHP